MARVRLGFRAACQAVWMLELTVAQIERELQWLTKVNGELAGRSPAARPVYDVD